MFFKWYAFVVYVIEFIIRNIVPFLSKHHANFLFPFSIFNLLGSSGAIIINNNNNNNNNFINVSKGVAEGKSPLY